MTLTDPIQSSWRRTWELPFLGTYVEFAEKNFKMPGSAATPDGSVDFQDAPWNIDVLNDCDPSREVNFNTFVKPIQAQGSGNGECGIGCALRFMDRGDIQYNWEDDDKALEKWKKRVRKFLEANADACDVPIEDNSKFQNCLILLGKLNFTMQGVVSDSNLSSDSIRFQVNEEIHNWGPGKLDLAYGRTTRWHDKWFHILNISNASNKGDQLHQAFLSGTQQEWQVKCPGCGLYHAMRAKWDDNEPQLGGLRYDSKGCKRDDGTYDYFKLQSTVRYQMPCGYEVHRFSNRDEDTKNRRKLSQSGRYSEPREGSMLNNRSRTLEAVSLHYIDWLFLIELKHKALRSLSYGDPEPWRKYRRERECLFVDPEDMPVVRDIVLTREVKKNRDGITNRLIRLYALDWQQGSLDATELWKRLPHWWLIIVDVAFIDGILTLQIVFEGHIENDLQVIEQLDAHGIKENVNRHHGVADSTWDTKRVQAFCLRYGINAIFASGTELFSHGEGVKRTFEPEKPLATNLGAALRYPKVKHRASGQMLPDKREPMFWRFSEAGVKDTLHHLQTAQNVKVIIPSDVSPEFRKHMESWRAKAVTKADGSIVMEWQQIRKDDHLYICFTYVAMQIDMAGYIGKAILTPAQKP